MKWKTLGLMSIMAISLYGCHHAELIPESATLCEEPRPEMCTRDYRPVCGTHSSSESKTYSNACTACGDSKVEWVIKGECTD